MLREMLREMLGRRSALGDGWEEASSGASRLAEEASEAVVSGRAASGLLDPRLFFRRERQRGQLVANKVACGTCSGAGAEGR